MRKYWIVTVGQVALLAACSSSTPAAPPTALKGTSWQLSAFIARKAITSLTLTAADTGLEFRAA